MVEAAVVRIARDDPPPARRAEAQHYPALRRELGLGRLRAREREQDRDQRDNA